MKYVLLHEEGFLDNLLKPLDKPFHIIEKKVPW